MDPELWLVLGCAREGENAKNPWTKSAPKVDPTQESQGTLNFFNFLQVNFSQQSVRDP